MTMRTDESDRFGSSITGTVYEVKKTVGGMAVLESLHGSSQIITELSNIALFYKREPKEDEDQG